MPDKIDPVRLAEARRTLQGELPVAAMTRLVDLLTDDRGTVHVDIQCGVDPEGIRYLRGSLSAEVGMQCQRCLENFRLALNTQFALGVVAHESVAERLPEHYEPLVVGEDPIFLRDIVEDELILSLPIVPKHPEGQCPAGNGGDEHLDEERRENPFAALKVLKTKKAPDEE
ncbi:MAG: YceD family protein [Gammaproteobacteria bacterium]|nr:YceD family protein [Gammaproteobacteria bacterium]